MKSFTISLGYQKSRCLGKKLYHGGGPTLHFLNQFDLPQQGRRGWQGSGWSGNLKLLLRRLPGCGVVGCRGEAVRIVQYNMNSELHLSSDWTGKQCTLHAYKEKCCSKDERKGQIQSDGPGLPRRGITRNELKTSECFGARVPGVWKKYDIDHALLSCGAASLCFSPAKLV